VKSRAQEILAACQHRPFPLPRAPWVMRQEWHNLLFAHWALPAEIVRPLVPAQLPLDLWQGQAYVGVVPFLIRNLRPRGVPPLPVLSHFAEINVRTYVTMDDKPGVYFFSLDAENVSAVLGARLLYGLPYFKSAFGVALSGDTVRYESRRTVRPKPAEFRASYKPTSDELPWRPMNETVERFITERYCLYNVVAGHVYRTNIHHRPWPLQSASAIIDANTMTETLSVQLDAPPPLLHFSKFLDVLVWWPERVKYLSLQRPR
jgi:hypothetical protein